MTRWRTEVPIWSPWKHISRFSGELTLGRVCWDFYFDKPWGLLGKPRVMNMAKERTLSNRGPWRSFAFTAGPMLLIVRRWK
jgi:hypothetical protein